MMSIEDEGHRLKLVLADFILANFIDELIEALGELEEEIAELRSKVTSLEERIEELEFELEEQGGGGSDGRED